MAPRSQANAVRLASRPEVPICVFLNRFGWFLARITSAEPQISNPSPLSLGSALKSFYVKVCLPTSLVHIDSTYCDTHIQIRYSYDIFKLLTSIGDIRGPGKPRITSYSTAIRFAERSNFIINIKFFTFITIFVETILYKQKHNCCDVHLY